MKAVLVTFSASYNFGASLQAYSLQRFLEEQGHDVSILDIRKQQHRPVSYFSGVKGLLFNGLIFWNRKKLDAGNTAFEQFSEAYFHLTAKRYPDYETAKNDPPQADVFLTGSDQVFNPERCDPLFYLDFVPEDRVRASYAASFGRETIPDKNKAKLSAMLARFDTLSLREASGAELVKQLTGRDAQVNIDPVFLTPPQAWRALEKPVVGLKMPYALCYCVYRPKNINALLREVKRVTGLPVVLVERSAHRMIAGDVIFVEYGPQEFLWLVDHAEFVFTTSFHGLAFSILFHKKVKPFENPTAPGRITNLLQVLDCKELLSATVAQAWAAPGVDRDVQIAREVKKSREYLAGAFEIHENP